MSDLKRVLALRTTGLVGKKSEPADDFPVGQDVGFRRVPGVWVVMNHERAQDAPVCNFGLAPRDEADVIGPTAVGKIPDDDVAGTQVGVGLDNARVSAEVREKVGYATVIDASIGALLAPARETIRLRRALRVLVDKFLEVDARRAKGAND